MSSHHNGSRRQRSVVLVVFGVIAGMLAVTIPTTGGRVEAAPAMLVVDDTADRVDTNPGDTFCRTSANTCSVRAAIQEANALPGLDQITVPPGTYAIAIAPVGEFLVDPANGDFDITDAVEITGIAGSANTFLDAGTPATGLAPEVHGLDRLLDVHPSAGSTTITGLTLRDGYSAGPGGAIRFGEFDPLALPPNSGTLRLVDVNVSDNYSGAYGGGVHVVGRARLDIVDSRFSGNGASAGGAAINNESTGAIVIEDSVIADNPGPVVADPTDPGGIVLADPTDFPLGHGAINNQAEFGAIGTIVIRRSTFAGNAANSDGAAIHNSGDGAVMIERSNFTGNITEAAGGAIHSAGGRLTIDDSDFGDNRAHDGGAIYFDGAITAAGSRPRFEITGSELDGNHAEASGGAIVSGGDTELTITATDFTANFAPAEGGAIAGGGRSSIEVTGSNFIGNQSSGSGGALSIEGERSGTIRDTLFRDNVAGVSSVDELGLPVEGDGVGGGLHHGGSGPMIVEDTTFEGNEAHGDGGALGLDGSGTVRVTDTEIRDNHARGDEAGGGGVENSGERVTFTRVLVTGNTATGNGGGIHNTSSNEFTVLDTTITRNKAENGGGFANASDSTLVMRGSLISDNLARFGPRDDTGLGGGLYSVGDAGGIVENTTISGNTARVRGGGVYNDADGGLRLSNVTIWRNSAPFGGGVGVMESDSVPTVPPTPLTGIILRNTIVAGSVQGGGCDGAVKSEGGNLDMGAVCFDYEPQSSDIVPVGDRMNADPQLDALADNGGSTMTHVLREGSVGIDGGVNTVTTILGTMDTCPEDDQRGLPRPVNERCDVGAYEHQGPFPPADLLPPDTEFLRGPYQDSLETMAFDFTGSDDESAIGFTPVAELTYECRLIELDPTQPVEPVPPGHPLPPELAFRGCASPFRAPLGEEGNWVFEVRAIDRAGRVDPTPASHPFDMTNLVPPTTLILEAPVSGTTENAATFTFGATDDVTPAQFMEYECRLDTRDPALWLECFNPMVFSNLEVGTHTFEVRAIDSHGNVDLTPARHTWTIAPPTNCDEANISLTAAADGWVDEVNPADNKALMTELTVNSDELPGNAARALFRFNLPTETGGCTLQSATLRLYNESSTEGRTLQAVAIDAPWSEQTLTWNNQPGTTGPVAATIAGSGGGYLRWDVTDIVAGATHGFLVRDAIEVDPEGGGDHSFLSRETVQDPPPLTLPQLVLRYEPGTTSPLPTNPPAPPVLRTVECGDVLTASTLISADSELTNCLGEGLVIGAPNIIVDLNGQTIDGPDYLLENATGQEQGFPAGIRNSGHDHVTIRNGTVQQFGIGVHLTAATWNNTIENLTILRNAVAGVELNDADNGRLGNRIVNSVIKDNELGVQLLNGSEGTTISGGEISGNLGEALYLWEANRNVVENVTIHGIPTDPTLDSDGGILLLSAAENVFRGNTIRDTGDAGLVISGGSDDNVIEDNTMYRNGDAGVSVQDSSGNRIIGNTMHLESDGGVVLNGAPDTSVIDNDVRFNPNGVEAAGVDRLLLDGNDGSDSQQDGFAIGSGRAIVVRDNIANRTGGSGIALEGGEFAPDGVTPIGPALIEGNTANENLAEGISVAAGGHIVADNNAHNNAGYGIASDALNVDGGGNRASGNGRPEQCLFVVCNLNDSVPVSTPDLTPPVTQFVSGPANGSNGAGATFEFTATDNATPLTAITFECRVDPLPDPIVPIEAPEPPEPGEPPAPNSPPEGEGWVQCSSPQFYSQFFEAGEHVFEVRASDYAHNLDLTPERWEWIVQLAPAGEGPDTMAPNTSIREAPQDGATGSVTFRFGGTDDRTAGPNMRYECALDPVGAVAWLPCTSPRTLTGLAAGSHRFVVRAVDLAGNPDQTPAEHTWTHAEPDPDATPPDTTIDAHPDPVTVLTSGTFRFSSPDATATFECNLDGSGFAPCTTPRTVFALDVGQHTFQVSAADPAGNRDPTPAAFTWHVTSQPVAATVHCGQLITQSVELTADLTDCPEIGLVVGAPRITIDLGGYTIDGVGLGVGVRNRGFDDVTITNGTVTGFDVGVHLEAGTAGNIVQSLTLNANQEAAVALVDADNGTAGNTVRRNEIAGNARGISLTKGSRGTLIHDNVIGANSGDGIRIDHSSANTVEGNQVTGSSGGGVTLVGAADNAVLDNELSGNGIVVGSGFPDQIIPSIPSEPPVVPEPNDTPRPSPSNVIEGNVLEGAGIEISESNGNQLVGNSVEAAATGIDLFNAHNGLISLNQITLNSSGIELIGSRNNRIESNNASETAGTGISLSALSTGNVVVGNTASVNGTGIYIGDPGGAGSGTVIERNIANSNDGDGITVSYPGHTITANTANDNGNWGIYVAAGSGALTTIDGGGNSAADNTQPAQCFGVRCDGQAAPPELVPPDTMVLRGPANPSSSSTATIRFTGSDNVSLVTFECALDLGAYAPCTSPMVLTGVTVGAHTFRVRAIDASGNVDSTPAEHSWARVASTAPVQTTIDSAPDPVTVETTATFTFSASEPGATFQCSLDGAAFAGCNSPATYIGLAPGAHTFEVRADGGATTAGHTWTIGAAPVDAALGCGEVVTQSVRLTNDIVECPGIGLVVGAPNITIDLNGHLVDGVGEGTGVLNSRHDGVTVTNGRITGFAIGVQLNPGVGDSVVSALSVESNAEVGVVLSDADGNIVRDNELAGNMVGVHLTAGTRDVVVRDNTFTSNTGDAIWVELANANTLEANEISLSGGAGINLVRANLNDVVGNTIEGNLGGGILVGQDDLPSSNNDIEANTLVTNGGAGISVVDSTGNHIADNVIEGSVGSGVTLELATNTVVEGNELLGNAGGIAVGASTGNRIEANSAVGGTGSGIALNTGSVDNIVRLNTASSNVGDGIDVDDVAPDGQGNLIERNTVNGNGGDGLIVTAPRHTITSNVANFNGGFGMFVVPGNVDGGGNQATGNVESQQCVGVVCEIGEAPGAPQTILLEGPPAVSNSHTAAFFYTAEDDSTPLVDIRFECRIDSTDPLLWLDCEYPAIFANLSAGEHTVEIRAIDAGLLADPTPVSVTWTYAPLAAGEAPDTEILLKPPAATPLFDALFTFTSNEPDVTFECRVDALAWVPCGQDQPVELLVGYGFFEAQFEAFELGAHTFRVRAIDIEGNVDSTPATHTWSITGGPFTTIVSGPADEPTFEIGEPLTGGQTTETTATFTYAADNAPDSTYECSLDLGPFVPCNAPAGGPDPSLRTVTYTGLQQGEHIFRVFATSPLLGEELEVVEYGWEVLGPLVNDPPQTIIADAPGNPTSELMFEFQGTDDVTPPGLLTFECGLDTLNPVEFVDCSSPLNILQLAPDGLAAGSHTFAVRAVDATDPDGQPDPSPATFTWTHVLDVVAPQTTITSGPAPRILGETPALVTFTGSDNATPAPPTDPDAVVPPFTLVFECSLDGAAFASCQSPADYTGLEPGAHTVRVRAVDTRGNTDSTAAIATWAVVGPPVTTFSTTPPVSTAATTATFAWITDQSPVTYTCTLNGWAVEPCDSPLTISELWGPSTLFTLAVAATNEFGLVEESPVTFTWTLNGPADTTAPDTTLTEQPPAITRNPHATFAFASSQIGSTFECSLDGAAFAACASPHNLLAVTAGEHTLRVRAVDASGNIDPSPASATWTVDGPPVTTITGFPPEDTTDSTATFTFVSSDAGSTFECFLDGLYEPCTSPKSYTGLVRGDHVFAVRATDPTGNLEFAWREHEWRIGIGVTFTEAPADPTDSTTATFAFANTIPGATMLCALDGAPALPCTSPRTFSNLVAGPHEFAVEVIDPAGLVDPLPIVYAWTIVDVTAPETTITDGPPNPSESATPTFAFSSNESNVTFQCRLDGATAFTACPVPAAFAGLAFGSHTLRVRAVDSAGLFDLSPAIHTWTIVADTTAPNTIIDAGPPTTNADIDAMFTFSGTDAGTPAAELTFECRLDSSPTWVACDSPHDVQDLAPGPHTLRVRAVDLELNIDPTPATFNWSVLGPTNTLAGVNVVVEAYQADPPNGAEPPATAQVTFPVVSVAGSTVMTLLTGAPALPSGFTVGGAIYYELRTTATFSGQPLVCFGFDPAAFPTPQSVRLLHHTGSAWQDVTSSGDPTNGEVCGTVSSFSPFALAMSTNPIGDLPPNTTLLVGPPALTVNFIHVLEFTGTDDWTLPEDLEFECLLDGVSLGTCSTLGTIEAPSAGEHLLQVRAIDALGQVDPTPAQKLFTIVDLTAPDTVVAAGPTSPTTERTATFQFVAEFEAPDPPGATFECALDGGDFAPCTSPYTLTIPEPAAGAHVLMVRAVDLAGNVDPTPDVYEWLIEGPPDTTPPDTIFVGGPPSVTPRFDALVTFTSNEVAVGFECSIDGGPFGGCEATVELAGLQPGPHSVASRAVDLAGNVDPTPASHSWIVADRPQTTITATPPNPSPGTTALFSFTSDQAGTRFDCAVDGAEWVNCNSPYLATFADPEAIEGDHTFQVRAVNLVNPESYDLTPSAHTWHVGLPPDTTITLAETIIPDPADPALTLRLGFAGSDDMTNPIDLEFECRLDTGPFGACSAPVQYDLTVLAPGPHRFEVRTVDLGGSFDPTPAGHDFSVEPTPETTILTGPDPTGAGTTATSATFTFTSDLTGVTFECRLDLDTAGYSPCGSGVTFTGLALGEHLLEVRAKVASGNVDQTPAGYQWLVGDDTPPTATILTAPPQAPATTTDTTVTFTFTGDANGGSPLTFRCSLSGPVSVALQACDPATGWANPTPLVPGAYTFELIPVTPHLLVDGEPQTRDFVVVDETDPQTTIVDGPNLGSAPDLASGPFAAFVFASNEAGSTFECSFDNTTWVSCSANQEYSSLTPGETTLSVRAIDPSGNVDETPASRTWTVLGPPETTIDSGPPATTTELVPTFTFSSDQSGVTFECSLDGGPFVDCTSPASYPEQTVGAHTFEVRATNAVGLVDPTPAERAWTIELPPDTTPPVAQVVTGPPATTTATQATFTFSANEPAVTFECAIDGGAFGSCTNPLVLNNVQPGGHTLAVRATDAAGNIGPASAPWAWTVDGPADTTITSGPLDDTRDTSATFEFTANETGVTFQCSLDGAAYATCTSPHTVTGLAPDSHVLRVRTVDSAGNVEPVPAEWSWDILEADPPEATITNDPPATTTDTTIMFTFISDEAGSLFTCSLDFAAYTGCTSPVTYNDLTVGTHVFAVRAIDPAGNVSPSDVATWTIEPPDTTPPVSTFGFTPGASTTATSATFEFTSNETGSTFNCSLDTAPFTACTSPVTVSGLALGNHTFRVRARDAAGNVESPAATFAWTVVAPPPDCGTEMTLIATGDAWFAQASAATNNGVDSTLKVTSKSANQNVRTAIRFGLPASIPPGCIVQSATLRVYSNSAVNGRTLRAVRLTANWNETAVTWGNQPASTGTPATTPSGTGWRTWNVTSLLQGAYDVNQLHGFLIRDASENQGSNEQQFHSREKTTERPELILRFGPAAPPPTTTTTTTTTVPPTTTTTTVPPTTTTTVPPACVTSTVTVGASADAWVLQSAAASNFAADSVLKVEAKTGNNSRALVRFDLPAIPSGCQVTNVQLRMFAGAAINGRTLQALRVNAAWTETGVTWGNQPATTGAAATVPSGVGWRQWAVTAHVQAMYSGANNGFLIRDASEGGGGSQQQLHSREKAPDNPPQLVITFGP